MNQGPEGRLRRVKGKSASSDPFQRGDGGLHAAFSTARKAGGRISIGRALEAYAGYLSSKGYSPHTIRLTMNLASAFYRLSGLGPRAAVSDVTPSTAERVMGGLRRRYREGTAWTYSIRLLALFRAFAAGGLILENPFGRLSPPPKPRPLMGPTLTAEEILRLLKAPRVDLPSGLRNRAILEVFYSTAIRLSECAHLETGDLDFSKGTLLIRHGKGGKDRVVPLGEEAIRWVKRYLKRVRPRFAPREERALWVGQEGRPVAPCWIQVMVRRLGRRARIAKPVTPHTLRRTCATHLLEGGASAWAVKEILGHADAKTLSRYLRLDLRRLKETHEKKHPRS